MIENASSSGSNAKPSGDRLLGLLFGKWFVAYLIPGVLLFLIKGYFAEQKRQKQQDELDQHFKKLLKKPDELGPAMKMLLGIDPATGAPVEQDAAKDSKDQADKPRMNELP